MVGIKKSVGSIVIRSRQVGRVVMASVSGADLFGGVGSNPTLVIELYFAVKFIKLRFCRHRIRGLFP